MDGKTFSISISPSLPAFQINVDIFKKKKSGIAKRGKTKWSFSWCTLVFKILISIIIMLIVVLDISVDGMEQDKDLKVRLKNL